MSKFEDLIKQLCPNGVDYKRFDEACTLHARIGWQRLTKAEYRPSGEYMLITGTDFTDLHTIDYNSCVYVSEERYIQDKKIQLMDGDVLITKDGTLGKVAQVQNLPMPATLNGGVFVVRSIDGNLEPRFILHYLLSDHFQKVVEQQKTGSTISHLTQELFSRLRIPIPPLEVQREIVRVLDSFTLLTAELTAELTDRKKQYDYYGNQLFEKIKDEVNVYSVGEIIISLKTGLNPRQNFSLNETGSCYPYITGKDIFDNKINVSERTDLITPVALELINKRAHLEKGLLLFASTGTGTVGRMAIIEEYNNDWGISETLYGIKVDEAVVLPHYLMFFLYSVAARKQFEPKISKGSVPHLKVKELLDVKIPVPSIEKQREIVKILIKFDSLCNDISKGIPAEINARQKQYEYYRDKLLSFKEMNC